MNWKAATAFVALFASTVAFWRFTTDGDDAASRFLRGNGLPIPPPELTPVVVERVQRLAEVACECQKSGGSDCRTDYEEAIRGYKVDRDSIAACHPISTSTDLIAYRGKEATIATRFSVVDQLPSDIEAVICRKSDAQAIEQAYVRGYGAVGDPAVPISDETLQKQSASAQASMLQALRDLKAGKKLPHSKDSEGCT